MPVKLRKNNNFFGFSDYVRSAIGFAGALARGIKTRIQKPNPTSLLSALANRDEQPTRNHQKGHPAWAMSSPSLPRSAFSPN
jgi:hypothetical protein